MIAVTFSEVDDHHVVVNVHVNGFDDVEATDGRMICYHDNDRSVFVNTLKQKS